MRFVHCSDLHLGIYKYGKMNYHTGLNTRLEEDLSLLDYVIDFAKDYKADFMFISGDVFDRKKPDAIVRREFIKRMKRLQEAKINTIVLMGNHDNVRAFDNEHCLAGEKLLTNKHLYIVDRCGKIDFPQYALSIVTMPSDQVKYDLVSNLEYDNAIVVGHFTIRGAKKDNHTFAGNEYISKKYFNDARIRYVAMGHIHQSQRISKKIAYSGSLNRIDFGDEYSQKGFIIGVLKNGAVALKFKTVEARKFLTIKNEWKKGLKKEMDTIDVKGKITRAILKSGYATYVPIDKIKKYLISRGAIVDSIKIDRQRNVATRDKQYTQNKSIIDLLKIYFKDDMKLIDMGIKILKEVE
jgi:exonuclease SbcD